MTDRFEGLPDEVVENAKKAHCQRCNVRLVEQESLTGTVFVNYYVPAVGARHRLFLCGACGLAFREFLYPSLLEDARFQAAKGALLARW